MKEFLYLDINYLESYLAQSEEGLETTMQVQKGSTKTRTKGNREVTKAFGGNAETGPVISKLLAKLQGSLGIQVKNAPMSVSRESMVSSLITKQLHDYMFDIFYSAEKGRLITEHKDMKPGEYMEYSACFTYIDFERIEELYTEENRKFYEAIEEDPEALTAFSLDEFDQVRRSLSFLKFMIPYDTFMYADNLLIVMKKQHLRELKQHIGFKLDGKITVVGKVSKAVPEQVDHQLKIVSTLNKIQRIALRVLHTLGFISEEEALIITPIAVFYENAS